MLSFFPWDVLDGILDLIGSVSEGFLTYYFISLVRAVYFTQFEKGILCPKSKVHQMEVFPWLFITVKPYIYLFLCFTAFVLLTYIFFSDS